MPAVLIVSMTLLCEMKYTKMGGIISITVTAMALPARAVPPDEIDDITYGSVLRLSLYTVPDGTADHMLWNENSSSVIHAGLEIGMISDP